MVHVFVFVKSVRGYDQLRTPDSAELDYIVPRINHSDVNGNFYSMVEYMTQDLSNVLEDVDYRFKHGDVVGVVEYDPSTGKGEIVWDSEKEEDVLSFEEALEKFD